MKTLKFFPGYPEMSDLTKPFIDELRKSYYLKVAGKDNLFSAPDEKQFLIAYSAGDISLAKYVQKNSENHIAKIILICPAGKINRGFFPHCWKFSKAWKSFYSLDKVAGKKVVKEVVYNFLRNPVRSIAKISRIASFPLDKFLENMALEGIKVVIIHVHEDAFMFNGRASKNARNLALASLAGHFAITYDSKDFADVVKGIIES